jgi:3-phenylpropionate/trans-cinnamate dioxygenase ferredoxin subunit
VSVFQPVVALEDLPEARAAGFEVDGQPVVVVRLAGEVHAMRNACAHAGARFDRAPCINHTLTCPMHGARFDVRTGRCVNSPYEDIAVYSARVRNGVVEVAVETAED